MKRQVVKYIELSNKSYAEVWDFQTILHKSIVTHKTSQRGLDEEIKLNNPPVHQLIFCEHSPVYTLGKSGSIVNLKLTEAQLEQKGIEYFKINRGGDITYHGPGQITGYPIFDMDCFFTDIHKYVRYLEQAIILLLDEFGIKGDRVEGYTGVWIIPEIPTLPKRKICAIGVHLSRWVTMHGFALNVNTDLNYFDNIIPCGIEDEDKTVTTISAELGCEVEMDEVRQKLKRIFAELFDFDYV